MAAAFSYAQAAKGIASAQPSKTPSESNTPVSKSDEQSSESIQTSIDAAVPKEDTATALDTTTVNNEKEVNSTDAKAEVSGASSSEGTVQASMSSKEDANSSVPNGTSESMWDKQSQASASDKQSTTAEGTEGKTAEKKKKEKPAPPKELKAAPLPAVNVWQQRREAQEAKVKATPASNAAARTGLSQPTSENSSVAEEIQDQPKSGSKKKGGEPSDKKKGDGVKGQESTPVPPVADATLWPTPQVAQGEEKKKAQEKSEKTEKSPVIRPHGKEKWTPVHYVPTAVFSTPLPTAARRGGRSARGGRDTTRNGAEKTSPGQATQGSTAKQATPGDRGRNEPNSARANSLPAPSRRSNSADNAPTDARKAQVNDRHRGPKGSENANATSAGKHVNGETFSRPAKPFPKNHEGFKNTNLSVDTHNGPRSGPNNERRFENGPKSTEFSNLHSDRKEKDFSREPRSERGRGSHRGRGGHAGYNGAQTPHFPNNHIAPQNYMHPKSFGYNDRRGPQQHGLVNGSRGHPMTMRSPSLPTSTSMYNMYTSFTPDPNPYGGYQPIPAGPMSAGPVPYQPYMETWSIMSMITMQLEYYFSVDNLCKDIYLRKHMDSQGFVPLSVIAGFKRVKQMTEDFELLRHVSRQLKAAEYYAGEDGVDRLRPRDKPEQWVLALDLRDPSAQNAGPVSSTSKNDTVGAHSHLDGATNGFVPKSSLPNGTIPSKTALSSAAPEFSPSNGVHTGSEISNVGKA
ncbi:hypothetical protein BDW62DRAFT_160301 [Aspergillus aurantiobrunneus]